MSHNLIEYKLVPVWANNTDTDIMNMLIDKLPHLQMEVYNMLLKTTTQVKPKFMRFYLYKRLFDERFTINDYPMQSFMDFIRLLPNPEHCIIKWTYTSKINENITMSSFIQELYQFAMEYDFSLDILRLQQVNIQYADNETKRIKWSLSYS